MQEALDELCRDLPLTPVQIEHRDKYMKALAVFLALKKGEPLTEEQDRMLIEEQKGGGDSPADLSPVEIEQRDDLRKFIKLCISMKTRPLSPKVLDASQGKIFVFNNGATTIEDHIKAAKADDEGIEHSFVRLHTKLFSGEWDSPADFVVAIANAIHSWGSHSPNPIAVHLFSNKKREALTPKRLGDNEPGRVWSDATEDRPEGVMFTGPEMRLNSSDCWLVWRDWVFPYSNFTPGALKGFCLKDFVDRAEVERELPYLAEAKDFWETDLSNVEALYQLYTKLAWMLLAPCPKKMAGHYHGEGDTLQSVATELFIDRLRALKELIEEGDSKKFKKFGRKLFIEASFFNKEANGEVMPIGRIEAKKAGRIAYVQAAGFLMRALKDPAFMRLSQRLLAANVLVAESAGHEHEGVITADLTFGGGLGLGQNPEPLLDDEFGFRIKGGKPKMFNNFSHGFLIFSHMLGGHPAGNPDELKQIVSHPRTGEAPSGMKEAVRNLLLKAFAPLA